MKSPVVKRSIIVDGRKTSVSLEDEFWKALKEIAAGRNMKVTAPAPASFTPQGATGPHSMEPSWPLLNGACAGKRGGLGN
jgi:Ribbon-helix-helix domain